MTVLHHEGQVELCCDHCPAVWPHIHAEEDFRVMIADAKAAGWRIRKIDAAAAALRDSETADLFGGQGRCEEKAEHQSFTHECPSCGRERLRASRKR